MSALTLPQITEATRGLAYLVRHAPDRTPLVEVGALLDLVAYHLDIVTDQLIEANRV